ncbi:MAG: radical SAM protein [Candidatus Nanoarchaeia archaeon]|nr:radical SAM protein [Candidatus Nanoarchaeia archaeon]
MILNKIGFYTLTEHRAKSVTNESPIMRSEIILTDRCNLKCPYCRGLKNDIRGDINLQFTENVLNILNKNKIQNIRFSGGEPTQYKNLFTLIHKCKLIGIKRIAISTNGTADLKTYKHLIKLGVNDFSISLDSGCCSIGDKMAGGIKNSWNKAVESIRQLSKIVYITIGTVFNEYNVNNAYDTIKFIDSLNPSDIRVIPSAQYNQAIPQLVKLPKSILKKYSILNYRLHNFKNNIPFRGIQKNDCSKCYLVLDDLAIAKDYHFPCIIYLREGGNQIGKMNNDFRKERLEWFKKHNSFNDNICKNNCLDVCRDYNNKVDFYVRKNARNII